MKWLKLFSVLHEAFGVRDSSHTKETKIVPTVTSPTRTFGRTAGSRAPTITVRLGLAGSTLASYHLYKSCCHLAQCCVNLHTCGRFLVLFKLTAHFQAVNLSTKRHLHFIPTERHGNFKQTSIKVKPAPCFLAVNHPYEICRH